jgi:AbrB family looped-hinge helix DNA binding protein
MSEKHKGPHFYSAVTVGDRGQIVIPAEARRDLGISAGDRLVIFGDPEKGHLMVHREESMRKFVAVLLDQLNQLDRVSPEIEGGAKLLKKDEE